jgi:branched-chain amino acid transport system substrate-binding protein
MKLATIAKISLCAVLGLTCLGNACYAINSQGPAAQAPRTLKVGFLTSLTGVGSVCGNQMLEGFKLYLSENHNKLDDRDVQLFVEDDQSSPSVAAIKLRKLVLLDKVDLIDGVLLSSVGYAISPLIEKYRVPALVAICGGDDLTQRRHNKWIVRCSHSSSQSTQAFGAWAAKHLPYKKVVTIGLDYAYGYESVGGFQRTFEDGGGEVVQKIWVPMGVTDFSVWLKNIKTGADAVYLAAISRSAVALPNQLRKAGFKAPIMASGATLNEEVLSNRGDAYLHAYGASEYSAALDRKENQKFVSAYVHCYGHLPSFDAESAYTSGLWMNQALKSVKGDLSDRASLVDALKSVRLKNAPRGPIVTDAFANPIENVYITQVERINGQLQNKVIDTIPSVSQFWKDDPDIYLKRPCYSRVYPSPGIPRSQPK